MKILLDTNILCRLADPSHRQHLAAMEAVELLERQGHELLSASQVSVEWWAVATRPLESNGLAMSSSEAAASLRYLEKKFPLVSPSPALHSRWFDLVELCEVLGKNAHDARLAAAGLLAGVDALLTFNISHFRRFGIKLLDPVAVVTGVDVP